MEKEVAEGNQLKEKQLKEMYNQLAKEKNEAFIKHFFSLTEAERNEKMKNRLEKWTANQEESFDGFWNEFKKDMLTKQEN